MAVSVEYRRAPEAKAPAQVEDTYASLKYVAEHASELGIDAEKIVVHGGSAGGGLGSSHSRNLARARIFRSSLSSSTNTLPRQPMFQRLIYSLSQLPVSSSLPETAKAQLSSPRAYYTQ